MEAPREAAVHACWHAPICSWLPNRQVGQNLHYNVETALREQIAHNKKERWDEPFLEASAHQRFRSLVRDPRPSGRLLVKNLFDYIRAVLIFKRVDEMRLNIAGKGDQAPKPPKHIDLKGAHHALVHQ